MYIKIKILIYQQTVFHLPCAPESVLTLYQKLMFTFIIILLFSFSVCNIFLRLILHTHHQMINLNIYKHLLADCHLLRAHLYLMFFY